MKNHLSRNPDDLRRQAEERLSERQVAEIAGKNGTGADKTAQTLHELQVHQIELEMQNDELRTAQAELEAGRARYYDLYDLAPVGYCTLSEQGLILEANLTAATMLGTTRAALLKQPISRFIFKDDQDIYYLHGKKLFDAGQPQKCELRLLKPDDALIWAHLTETAAQAEDGTPVCRVALTDITERKRLEMATRESEARQRYILSVSPTVIYTLRPNDFAATWVSPNVSALMGYTAEEALEPGWWAEHVHPEDREQALANSARLRETRHIGHEYRFFKKDGTVCWLYDRMNLHSTPGDSEEIIGAWSDITERKQAEIYREMGQEILEILNEPGDLQESIQRVLATLKARTGVDAVGLRLQEGEDYPYFVQDGFSKDFLQTENTLVERGKNGGVCRDKDGKVCLECTCGLVISGKTNPANPLFTKGGSSWTNDSFPLLDLPFAQDPRLHPRNNCIHQGYASVALIPVRTTDRIVGLIQLNDKRKDRFTLETIEILEGIAAHIGSALMRKQAERELRRLSTAIEQSPETMMITDTEGTIQYVNPAFQTITGYTCEEAIGQNPRILKSGQHDADVYTAMWKTLLDGQVWEGRLINKRKDDSLYTEDVSIAPVKDPNGTITNYVAVKRDITAELEREDMLRQAQKMESVGRLAGGVAHDFNNMLTIILGQAQLLAMKLAADAPHRHNVAEIVQAAQRSANLTRQLLAFARKETIAPVPLDLNGAVGDLLKMLRRLIGEDIDLSWQPGAKLWRVKMDPGQLDQLLVNLCVNARDAIDGVGKVTIETENVSIDEEYCRSHVEAKPGHYVMLTVSDDGCGMDAETMSQVFEPFFTTKPTGEGTGLGLATVYGIIKQNMGFVNVCSELEKGTTFRLYLPRLAGKESRHDPRQSPQPCPHGNETVLLVEDEPAVREIAQAFLEECGYRVLEADCPATALDVAAANPETIDLLLTDVVMPGMNGRDLAERLTAGRPSLRVLYMSGYTASTIVHRGVLDQGVQFISKPFTLEELARKVREVLG